VDLFEEFEKKNPNLNFKNQTILGTFDIFSFEDV
jgi:hypothetical protein